MAAEIQKISLAEIISPWLVICCAIQPDAGHFHPAVGTGVVRQTPVQRRRRRRRRALSLTLRALAEIISPWLVICCAIQPDACCCVIPIPCS
jgi:hypothetical protein